MADIEKIRKDIIKLIGTVFEESNMLLDSIPNMPVQNLQNACGNVISALHKLNRDAKSDPELHEYLQKTGWSGGDKTYWLAISEAAEQIREAYAKLEFVMNSSKF
jgi:hypothetical protein